MIRREHPTHDDFARAVETLERRYSGFGAGEELYRTKKEYTKTAYRLTPNLAAILNPLDGHQKAYVYDKSVMRQAIFFGQAAGILLVLESYSMKMAQVAGIYENMHELPVAVPDKIETASSEEQRRMLSTALLDVGFDGLGMAGRRAQQWLGRLACDMMPTEALTPYFNNAAGIAIMVCHDGIEEEWRRRRQAQWEILRAKVEAAHDIDWDLSLSELEDGRIDP